MAGVKDREPRSPHSVKSLGDVSGRELDAWVAQELDGYNGVGRRPDGDFEGVKAGRRLVPDYRTPTAVRRLAENLTSGRRLVLSDSSVIIDIDNATPEQCELANRAMVLESMNRRGAV